MTDESNIIKFPVERREQAIQRHQNRHRIDRFRAAYLRLKLTRRELGFTEPNPALNTDMARIALRLCDTMLRAKDAEGDQLEELMEESSSLLMAYEAMKKGNDDE
ncbi:hypothetical protein [Williamsia sterculiae]|uniref:Uncharacterized protein n=1 Tax=Williamsia sterculiae TaxID=1344003 RepID=A0A1N7GGT8_9NOCA|nr:hypothetical protein [Williamsia sterculiae]SIS11807.1 hypothetical protein SAMN05445060_2768 [Williamsia sterculiae]